MAAAPVPAKVTPAAVPVPVVAKVEVAKVEVAKAPEPAAVAAAAPVAKAPEPAVVPAPVAKAAEPVAPPKPVAKAPALVVAKAREEAPPRPEKAAVPKAVPAPAPAPDVKSTLTDAKIAGMYPGVLKKPVTEPVAVPAPEKPLAADRPLARLTTPAEGSPQKTFTPRQQSDNLYKQAVALAQQGQGKEARELLGKSLEAFPQNAPARQLLVGLLVEANKLPDALSVLREGVKLSPDQGGMWMNLARLQLEFGDGAAATATLEQGLPAAGEDGPYNAFYAAVLQRAGRHDGALKHYLVALRSDPAMPNWLVGAGISMQALGRDTDAAEAFQRAKDGGQLPPAFASFVDQRLVQLKR
jgi:MSHA biogenesis protein MshN